MDTLDFTHFISGEDGYEWFYGHMTNTIYLIKFDADDWQSRLIELSFLTEIDDSYLNMGFSYRDPESPKDKLRPQDIEAINKGYRYRVIRIKGGEVIFEDFGQSNLLDPNFNEMTPDFKWGSKRNEFI